MLTTTRGIKSFGAASRTNFLARSSEPCIDDAVAGSGLVVWDWDICTQSVKLTAQWQAMLGRAPEPTLIGMGLLSEQVHRDDIPVVRGRLLQVLKGHVQRVEVDHRIMHPAEGWIWVHTTGTVVSRDSTGRARRMVGAILDIRHHKRAEQRMRESEERFRRAFVQAGAGFHLTSVYGDFLQVNDKYCEITGFSKAELLSMNVRDTLLPADRTDSEHFRSLMIQGKREIGFRERWIKRKDGSMLWVSASVSLVRDEQDLPQHFMSVIHDISEHKRTLADLHEVRSQFEQLVNHMPQVFWIASADLRETVYVSPACEQLLGHDANTLRNQKRLLIRAVHQEDRRKVLDARKRISEDGYDLTYRIHAHDRSVRWVRDRAFPVMDERGVVHRYAGIIEDITQRRIDETRMERLAHYDALTGLPNRVLFSDRLQQCVLHASRGQRRFCVMFLDVDHFKRINDSFGHASGDLLLQQVARRLAQVIRTDDSVCRMGGDEFAILLSDISHDEDVERVARKISDTFDDPFQIDGMDLNMTVSFGGALFPADGRDAEELLKSADAAMYEAKAAGRNQFKFYSAELNNKARDMIALEISLRRALCRGEFEVYYQPKGNVNTRAVTGYEALLRWNHPQRGMISPAEFVPALEQSGLILQVGEWVFEAVCAQLAHWKDAGEASLPIAVNLSPRQFESDDLARKIQGMIEKHGVDPRCIELEITESSLMKDPERARCTLVYLKTLGIKLAIDDFGTGYSSLAYLKRFPIDTLKIDASFVRDIISDADDAIITQTVIAMAHNMNLNVVAEGVEDQLQLEFLQDNGCDQFQGYFLSRPLPARAFDGVHAVIAGNNPEETAQ